MNYLWDGARAGVITERVLKVLEVGFSVLGQWFSIDEYISSGARFVDIDCELPDDLIEAPVKCAVMLSYECSGRECSEIFQCIYEGLTIDLKRIRRDKKRLSNFKLWLRPDKRNETTKLTIRV